MEQETKETVTRSLRHSFDSGYMSGEKVFRTLKAIGNIVSSEQVILDMDISEQYRKRLIDELYDRKINLITKNQKA